MFWRQYFNWTVLSGTLSVFASLVLVGWLLLKFDSSRIFVEALQDYNITDIYFSKLSDERPQSPEIVLVNFGDVDRTTIAQMIESVNKYEPKVIGIHKLFAPEVNYDDPIGDSLLSVACSKVKNLVLMSDVGEKHTFDENGEVVWDSLAKSIPQLSKYGVSGFGKILPENEKQFNTWREVEKKAQIKDGTIERPFAAQVLALYDSSRVETFYKRRKNYEFINFKGDIDEFTKLDIDNVLEDQFTAETVKGKIVLFGYMGSKDYTADFWDGDKFYTPMNAKQVGRGIPDMYSVIVQANIIDMMLTQDYINELPNYARYILAFLICYFNIALFTPISQSQNYGVWFGLVAKIIQLVEVIILVAIIIGVFSFFNLKLDLTLSIFCVLLSADIMELYYSLVLNAFYNIRFYLKTKFFP